MSRLEAKLEKEETKCITFRAGSNDKTYYIPMECSLKETPMDVASVVLWVHGEFGLHFVTDGPQHQTMYSINQLLIGFDNTLLKRKMPLYLAKVQT